MEDKNKNEGFQYTYSAKEQAELKRIREKYAPPEEDKMARLRRLDAGVTRKARAIALMIGVLGSLILGFGMSLAMTELSDILGVYSRFAMLIGVAIGLTGGLLASLAYPIYHAIVRRERVKLAPEILRLTDELMK